MLFVGGERDGELVLGLELGQRRHRVGGDAKDIGIGTAEIAAQAREVDGLLGAAGGVGTGIEIEHELASGEVGQ